MLVALALAAQLTTAQTPDELLARQRTILTYGFDEVIEELGKMERRARGANTADKPVLGMVMELKELGGTPPWRAIMVTGVIPGSAADLAGIKPGDRISAIGTHWLEHNTCVAAALYMSEFPRSVPLVIGRDGKLRTVTLRRKVEPCVAAAYRTPDMLLWRTRIANLGKTVRRYRSQVSRLTTPEGITAAGDNLYATIQLAIMMGSLQERDTDTAVTASCGVPFLD